jgi:hypothetical protein
MCRSLVFPEIKTRLNLRRAAEAIDNVQIYSELLPIASRGTLDLPGELFKRRALKADQVLILYSQDVGKLSSVDAMLRIGSEKSGFVLAQVPIRIFLSP